MLEIICDDITCRYNQEGVCKKEDGIHIDHVGFCMDNEEVLDVSKEDKKV